jgi:hypothetical protein
MATTPNTNLLKKLKSFLNVVTYGHMNMNIDTLKKNIPGVKIEVIYENYMLVTYKDGFTLNIFYSPNDLICEYQIRIGNATIHYFTLDSLIVDLNNMSLPDKRNVRECFD